ncbi:MAG: dihydrodipicolinate synthase family protein [Ignavibacteriae bacterium]|nr:dihydrodipicolinate synthase family protein [Ignavibacteriota bacterium]MCB9217493.1 dihydrodipicolinate synthase family protein [Ignavibacteria bacterium]
MSLPQPLLWVTEYLQSGVTIPAHPLALDANRRFDERSQRALTRYYHAAGAGGLAVGVHTTQFAIRNPEHNLLRPVLELAAETARVEDERAGRSTILVAGILGNTQQAVAEAKLARDLGYHLGLLSLAALPGATDEELIDHARAVAAEIPLFGFYLQPSVGGRILSRSFWREFCAIENVMAIKVAPFNRYGTLDVLRGVVESGRAEEVALYTGNDDTIIYDLLTDYQSIEGICLKFVGGLLGHWAVWTKGAVELLAKVREWKGSKVIPREALQTALHVTEMNGAIFDAAHNYAGCIPGIHYVLYKQGLIESINTLDPSELLSPGQREEIERVIAAYPHLVDDDFVRDHLEEWRS